MDGRCGGRRGEEWKSTEEEMIKADLWLLAMRWWKVGRRGGSWEKRDPQNRPQLIG